MSTLKVDAIGKFDTTANAITFDSNNNASFTGSVNATNPMMNRNILINGGMNVWQRQTSRPSLTGTDYHTADRYVTTIISLGTWTQSRSTDVPSAQGFGYSLKMDCTTADASPGATGVLVLQQKIEGQNLQHMLKGTSNAKNVTVSFWVKSSKTGTYILELHDNDNDRHICKAYTIDAANTWEKKELVFDADTTGTFDNDVNSSLAVNWWLGAGSDHNSGTLATSWAARSQANAAPGQVNLGDSTSNEWYVTGCQVEVGSKATNFEFEPYETVLRKCERYYEHSFHEGQFEGYVTSAHCWHTSSFSSTDGNCQGPFFRVVKRDTPAVRLYSSSLNTAGQVSSGGTPRTSTASNITTRYVSYINVISGTGLTYCRYNYAAESEL